MKKLMMLLMLAALPFAQAADTSLDPSYLKIKVYKLSVSTSVLCTNPIAVFEDSNPSYGDVLVSPQLGNGQLANGTYPCVILEMSDYIKYSPTSSSDSGHCVSGTEYTLDVCGDHGGGATSFQLADGTTGTCANSEQRVALYLSSTSTATGGNSNAFLPPAVVSDSTRGFNLASVLEVTGTSTAKFVVNGTGKVCDTADAGCDGSDSISCEMQPPVFSFSKVVN